MSALGQGSIVTLDPDIRIPDLVFVYYLAVTLHLLCLLSSRKSFLKSVREARYWVWLICYTQGHAAQLSVLKLFVSLTKRSRHKLSWLFVRFRGVNSFKSADNSALQDRIAGFFLDSAQGQYKSVWTHSLQPNTFDYIVIFDVFIAENLLHICHPWRFVMVVWHWRR